MRTTTAAGWMGSALCILGLITSTYAQQNQAKPEDLAKVQAALPTEAPAKPAKARKVLIYGGTGTGGPTKKGFVHKSIPLGCETIKLLGQKTGAFDSVISYDASIFTQEKLAEFDGIVLVSTTHDFLDVNAKDQAEEDARKKALLNFVRGGKGLVGIHAAGDAYYYWPEYGQMMGGFFTTHHAGQEKISVVNEDPSNPVNAPFAGKGFEFADEIYRFLPKPKFDVKQAFSRENVHVLLSVDPTKHNNEPAGTDMPVAWIHQYGRGHVFYCSLGHNEYVYWDPTILKFYLSGIQYALGDLKGVDDKPAQKTAAKEEDVKKMEAALPDKAPATPQKSRKVLAFGRAQGFVHSSIPLGCKTVEMLGKKTGAWDTVISFDPSIFTPEKLKEFDAIVLVSTTGNFLDDRDSKITEARRAALIDFVKQGKGVAGIHAAGDAYYNWPEYGQLIGGYFNGHPWQKVTVKIDDPASPITAPFHGQEFQITDETYTYKKEPWSRDKLHVLMSIDVSKMSDADRSKENRPYDHDYGLSWIHRFGEGRVFYAAHGHSEHVYWDKPMLEHYLAGIQYAIGDLKADDTPSAKEHTASAK